MAWLQGFYRLSASVLMLAALLPGLVTAPSIAHGETAEKQDDAPVMINGYRVVEWTELMPEDDLEALLNPPEDLNDIPDGSVEDQIASQVQLAIGQANDSRYQQALVSTRVVSEFDGRKIRLPGFIVPLEFGDERQQVTRFFLVPYFGACIHLPPPPPNQIVYAEFDSGFKLESMYQPFWLSGRLSTTLIENDLASAAYAIEVDKIEPYLEE